MQWCEYKHREIYGQCNVVGNFFMSACNIPWKCHLSICVVLHVNLQRNLRKAKALNPYECSVVSTFEEDS